MRPIAKLGCAVRVTRNHESSGSEGPQPERLTNKLASDLWMSVEVNVSYGARYKGKPRSRRVCHGHDGSKGKCADRGRWLFNGQLSGLYGQIEDSAHSGTSLLQSEILGI